MASGPFTLAGLARVVGMSVEDVRYYRKRGLLQPARRQRGRRGDVAYHEEHLDRLRLIARDLTLGFTFDDIAALISTELITCADVYRIAEKRLQHLKELAGSNAIPVMTLEQLMGQCTRAGGRRDCAILAALSTNARDGAVRAAGQT
jgi:DNA-binding transcriptional MerR regulator